MICEIILNIDPDEESEINVKLNNFVYWFDTPQLESLTELLNEITDDDVVDVFKLADLAGIEV